MSRSNLNTEHSAICNEVFLWILQGSTHWKTASFVSQLTLASFSVRLLIALSMISSMWSLFYVNVPIIIGMVYIYKCQCYYYHIIITCIITREMKVTGNGPTSLNSSLQHGIQANQMAGIQKTAWSQIIFRVGYGRILLATIRIALFVKFLRRAVSSWDPEL